jgi:hypothetical protein
VKFAVPTMVDIKITVLWDVTPHSSVDRFPKFWRNLLPPSTEQLHNIISQMAVTLISRVNNSQTEWGISVWLLRLNWTAVTFKMALHQVIHPAYKWCIFVQQNDSDFIFKDLYMNKNKQCKHFYAYKLHSCKMILWKEITWSMWTLKTF